MYIYIIPYTIIIYIISSIPLLIKADSNKFSVCSLPTPLPPLYTKQERKI